MSIVRTDRKRAGGQSLFELVADVIREFEYDFFVDEYVDVSYPPKIGGNGMRRVDTERCVLCESRAYVLASGRTPRVYDVVCDGCLETPAGKDLIFGKETRNEASKDESKRK